MSGCLHRFVRRAYYGGRTEVFRDGYGPPPHKCARQDKDDSNDWVCYFCMDWELSNPPLNYGDVNSMYAWAMLGPVPTDLSHVKTGNVDLNRAARLGYLGFVECTVKIPDDCYLPPLPVKHEGKLLFPVGTFHGVWTSEELATVEMVGGSILKMERSVWFRGSRIFEDYINHWYKYRNKDAPDYDPATDMVAKQFMVSLYGKFGMNADREKLWFYPTDEDFAEHELRAIADEVFGAYVEKTYAEPPYVIPHIAAYVTSRARVLLFTLMLDMLRRNHLIYYCDTDSIITSAPVKDSRELGGLKKVCEIASGIFVAPKMYFLNLATDQNQLCTCGKEKDCKRHYVKAKGFAGGFGSKSLTEKEFMDVVNHIAKVKISRMRKVREGIRTGKRFPAMHHTEKGVRLGVLDEKRIHLPGGNTRPVNAVELSS